jgi:thymidylate synthase
MKNSEEPFRQIYGKINIDGEYSSPRGQLIKEIQNAIYVLPPFVRFANFKARKLNINYIKQEFCWYLRGDKFDSSICEHATLWKSIMNKDGSFNSNYGQYFFGKENQFDRVVNTLALDKDSRRASIMLLTKDHLASDTNDIPCTYALNFRIRNNTLNMTVHMRSQDCIYGLGNDAPAFSFLHEMVLNALRAFYPDLAYGNYVHFVDSLHVYEKHFKMIALLPNDEYIDVDCPPISGPGEVKFLRALDFTSIPEDYKFTRWLTTLS